MPAGNAYSRRTRVRNHPTEPLETMKTSSSETPLDNPTEKGKKKVKESEIEVTVSYSGVHSLTWGPDSPIESRYNINLEEDYI